MKFKSIDKLKSYLIVILFFSFLIGNTQHLLTKEEAVSLALDYNFGVLIAKNTVEIAENNADLLNTGYLPTLTGNGGANFNKDNTEAEFSNGNSTKLTGAESSRYNASVNLNYTLFDGMGRYYNYKRLKEEYQLTELQARETIENTVIDMLTMYFQVANMSQNVSALEKSLEISRDRLKRAEYQFEYGQDTKLGMLNAEVDRNNDSISVINMQLELEKAKRNLNVVIGNSISSTFEVDTLVTFKLGLKKEDLYQKMLDNNVILLQNEKNIAISQYDVKMGKSGYLPRIGLTGSYGWSKNNNNPASFVTVSTNTGIAGGLNLTWDIFDSGSTITRVKNARIALENQQILKEQIEVEVERNFNNAWDHYLNKMAVYQIEENNILTALNNFERTQEKFKMGQVNSLEFRQAQINLLNAVVSKNQAKYEAKLAEIILLQISGELLNVAL